MIVSGENEGAVAVSGFIIYAVVNMTYIMTPKVLYYPFQKFICKVVVKM